MASFFFPILRAKSGRIAVREHRVEITKSGLELHPWERSCGVGQWPWGNTPGNHCFNNILVLFFFNMQDERRSTVFSSCHMKPPNKE